MRLEKCTVDLSLTQPLVRQLKRMANTIHVLDCTLRDGGYVNDWRFGDDNAVGIVELTAASGVEYAELAFVRTCEYEKNKMQFSDMGQIAKIFLPSRHKLSAMVEIGYGYPVKSFPFRSENTVDMIRIVVWKRMISESLEYAKALVRKGYNVGIQATRIEQYDDIEFRDFVRRFSEVSPFAVYIVDTFGLLTKERLLEYAAIADENLGMESRVGYHAHNNMQQAVSNMMAICEHPWRHELMLDASVMGIGRGAGNLCLELLEKYLNENHGGSYDPEPLYECADRYIQPIFNQTPWGYSVPYLLSAMNGRNPSYVAFMRDKNIAIPKMKRVFELMRERDVGIRFDPDLCNQLVQEVLWSEGR